MAAAGVSVRTLALAPGRRGGLDDVVPVVAPTVRAFMAAGPFRDEARWADVVLLVGDADDATDSRRWRRDIPPVVVDRGDEPIAVPLATPTTPAARAAARRELGVDESEFVQLELDAGARPGEHSELRRAAADVAVVRVDTPTRPGRAFLLAAGSGLPVVAPAGAGLDAFVDDATGVRWGSGGPDLAAAVASLADDLERCRSRGAAMADRVRDLADPDAWTQRWVDRCEVASHDAT